MPVCDISGKQVDKLYRVEIEGSIMHVAKEYIHHGKLLEEPQPMRREVSRAPRAPRRDPDEDLALVEGAGGIIKRARESRSLTQEELARRLSEKESLLHKIESGHLEPSIPLARKIERFLKVSLIEEAQGEQDVPLSRDKEGMTLGDYIKVR